MNEQVESWADVLPEGTHAVAVARRVVRRLLADADSGHLIEAASLATSELVTNALVHAGPGVRLAVWAARGGVRVEVRDRSPHLPSERGYAVTAATGRGLRLVGNSVDRWGTTPRPDGKTVWFEIGALGPRADDLERPAAPPEEQPVEVRLQRFPVLMHWAWQEHASALLREYLLYACEDDPAVLEGHAQASDALGVLREQMPLPELPDDPEALLDQALEPGVTAPEAAMLVPARSVAHFRTLGALLSRATEAARRERFLSPPTQPEIEEMREWITLEVQRQVEGEAPTPWEPRTEVRTPLDSPVELERRYAALTQGSAATLVTNEASVIVSVSRGALDLLGYDRSTDLVGRRILVVVPTRYHQAHIAGTTLNATNGRDKLLGVPITVPVVRADGSEVPLLLHVVAQPLQDGETVFVATMSAPEADPA